jgi:hypothetical protein
MGKGGRKGRICMGESSTEIKFSKELCFVALMRSRNFQDLTLSPLSPFTLIERTCFFTPSAVFIFIYFYSQFI